MRRKLLTAQDVFVGVREGPESEVGSQKSEERRTAEEGQEEGREMRGAGDEAVEEVEAGEEEPEEEDGPRRRRRAPAGQGKDGSPWTPKEQRLMMAVVKDLTGALRVIKKEMDAKGPPERLTLYLEPEVAGQLNALWREVREATELKVGKSAIAGAAVRMVLKDPPLRAAAAIMAVRERMGERD